MTDKEILDYIPTYPKACSEYLLALKLGYIKDADDEKNIRKGLKKLERRLAWTTLRNKNITESRAVLQKSTENQLQEHGIEIKREGEISYFSLLETKEEE